MANRMLVTPPSGVSSEECSVQISALIRATSQIVVLVSGRNLDDKVKPDPYHKRISIDDKEKEQHISGDDAFATVSVPCSLVQDPMCHLGGKN